MLPKLHYNNNNINTFEVGHNCQKLILFLFSEESVSVDSIKNALKLYQKWGILECHTENKLRLYYLKDSEDNSESVNSLYSRISKFRETSR